MNDMLFRIAIRNVLRQKRRTVLSALTIAFGLMLFLTLDSLYSGLDRAGIDSMISLTSSALKIETKEYTDERETLPLKYGLQDIEAVSTALRADERVTGVAPRTRFAAELTNGVDAIPVQGIVIDPAADAKVFAIVDQIRGTYLDDSQPNQMVLGKKLAEELGLKVGESVTLSALTRHEAHNADEFTIVGLMDVTDPSLNKSTVLISFATANTFLELESLVTELNVSMKRRVNFRDFQEDMLNLKEKVSAQFPALTVQTFLDLGASFLAIAKQKKSSGMVILSVLLLIAAVGIFNTVMMSVFERIREIGVLRAHGMPPGAITRLFIFEGFLTGVVGCTLGLLLGSIFIVYLTTYGYPMDKIAGDTVNTSSLPVWGTLYGEWNPSTMVTGYIFGVIVAVLASVIPARMASKLTITRALRFV